MFLVLACGSLLCADFEMDVVASQAMHCYAATLSDSERDRIRRECEFATRKMYYELNAAKREAGKICDTWARDAIEGAIEGAIAGLSGRSAPSVILGGLLGAMARIGAQSYHGYAESLQHVRDAEAYARRAEELQEQLWRG